MPDIIDGKLFCNSSYTYARMHICSFVVINQEWVRVSRKQEPFASTLYLCLFNKRNYYFRIYYFEFQISILKSILTIFLKKFIYYFYSKGLFHPSRIELYEQGIDLYRCARFVSLYTKCFTISVKFPQLFLQESRLQDRRKKILL